MILVAVMLLVIKKMGVAVSHRVFLVLLRLMMVRGHLRYIVLIIVRVEIM